MKVDLLRIMGEMFLIEQIRFLEDYRLTNVDCVFPIQAYCC